MSLFQELKRRNVFRVSIAYIVLAWLVMQVADVILNNITAPGWVFHVLLLFLAVGFPFAVFFAWAFELTPDGLKREHEVERVESITHNTGRKLDFTIIAVLVLALGYFAYDKMVLSSARDAALVEATAQAMNEQAAAAQPTANSAPEDEPEAETDRSIAVLPFADMSPNKDQDYFSDGLSEELLNLLAKIPELRVAARTSSFSFKGQNLEITDIAERLKVAHVLEGSVRMAGNQIRITAQLIKADDGYHMWSQTYDRTLDNIFAIQDEIANEVVAQLKLTLLGAAPMVSETDPEAYALFLQARHLGRLGTVSSVKQAIVLYQQALEFAPDYPAAWVGLSYAYGDQAISGHIDLAEGYRLSSEAANKALSIAPDFAPAHASLGSLAILTNEMAESAARYSRALELAPANPDILRGATGLTRSLGRFESDIKIREYLIALDPVDAGSHASLGQAYTLVGRLDEAITSLNTALTLSPGRINANYHLGTALLFKGEPEAALAAFEQEYGDEEYRTKGMALALHDLGRQQEHEAAFSELRERWGKQWPSEIAQVYAYTGDADAAFEWLDKSISQNEDGLNSQFFNLFYKSLHSDPRWAEFRQKSGSSEAHLAAIEFEVSLPE